MSTEGFTNFWRCGRRGECNGRVHEVHGRVTKKKNDIYKHRPDPNRIEAVRPVTAVKRDGAAPLFKQARQFCQMAWMICPRLRKGGISVCESSKADNDWHVLSHKLPLYLSPIGQDIPVNINRVRMYCHGKVLHPSYRLCFISPCTTNFIRYGNSAEWRIPGVLQAAFLGVLHAKIRARRIERFPSGVVACRTASDDSMRSRFLEFFNLPVLSFSLYSF